MKADHAKVSRLLKTARGQLDGVLRMVDDDRYCLDIYNQILAAMAVLDKVSREVMKGHLEGCVREAFETGKEAEKIEEILKLLQKLTA